LRGGVAVVLLASVAQVELRPGGEVGERLARGRAEQVQARAGAGPADELVADARIADGLPARAGAGGGVPEIAVAAILRGILEIVHVGQDSRDVPAGIEEFHALAGGE